jgi:hypothetical protein
MNRVLNLPAKRNAAIMGFIALVATWSIIATAEAASYYASPSGSGTACSSSSPCSLPTAIGKAVSGDTVIAKNGTYSGSFGSKANGVVIKAENKWGATLKNNNDERIFAIDHSKLTVKGFRFDSQKVGSKGAALVVRSNVSNVLIEHNHFLNPGAGAIKGGGTNNVDGLIIRHNLVEDTGWGGPGEAFYIGSSTYTADNIFNVQIYGNTVRRYTTGGVDLKPNSVNVDVLITSLNASSTVPIPIKVPTKAHSWSATRATACMIISSATLLTPKALLSGSLLPRIISSSRI